MATKFSPCKGSYVLNQFPSNVMFGMNGFHVSASGAIQGHHGPLVFFFKRPVRQARENKGLFGKGLKAFADCKLNVAGMNSAFDRTEH